MAVLSGLKPEKVFEYFELLNSVPRGSGNTKQVSDLCVNFAKERGLEYYQDEFNNVIIIKEASAGYEGAEPVIIQGHLDMVCAKDPENPVDMSVTPVKMAVDGDWIFAIGTSLGADDGVAVAIAMALLDDPELQHPRIEAVFTTDEETGMDGAAGLDMSPLKGRRLLNLDSDEEGTITAGCAGGARVDFSKYYENEPLEGKYTFYRAEVSGLLGGHSGAEIDKGRGNSNKIMAAFLRTALETAGMRLISIDGGTFDNVIANKTTAIAAVKWGKENLFENTAIYCGRALKEDFIKTDRDVCLKVSRILDAKYGAAMNPADAEKLLTAMDDIPQGVQKMSADLPGLVQTSLNFGTVRTEEDRVKFSFSVRSSVGKEKNDLINLLREIGEDNDCEVSLRSPYPEWEFKKVSAFRDMVRDVCAEVLGKEIVVTATHGGLECGLFSGKLEGLDCVSIGPNMYDIHSPRERVSISSVAKLYEIVKEILARSR